MTIGPPRTEALTPFRLRDGKIQTASGLLIKIPSVIVEDAIDGGAHGEVFLGSDLLGRKIAVKVWKKCTTPRGFERAKEEVRKLAELKDYGRLFAHVYLFGAQPVPGQPDQRIAYAVLEYVDGVSGKNWLKSDPDFQARYAVWKLVYAALSLAYADGILHGDPHLGNIIVSTDPKALYKEYLPAGLGVQDVHPRWELSPYRVLPPLGLKFIDLGSSHLWNDHTGFVAKESRVISENFVKLFPEIGSAGIEKKATAQRPRLTLEAHDVWLEYSIKLGAPGQYLRRPPARDDRSYDDLSEFEQAIQGLLFARPLVRETIIRQHMQNLGLDYAKLFGKAFKLRKSEYLAAVGAR